MTHGPKSGWGAVQVSGGLGRECTAQRSAVIQESAAGFAQSKGQLHPVGVSAAGAEAPGGLRATQSTQTNVALL